MSWNKKSFQDAYSRSRSLRQATKDLDDEEESQFWCDYYRRDDHDDGPTMADVRIGWLLNLLAKLHVKTAKDLLDIWYW